MGLSLLICFRHFDLHVVAVRISLDVPHRNPCSWSWPTLSCHASETLSRSVHGSDGDRTSTVIGALQKVSLAAPALKCEKKEVS